MGEDELENWKAVEYRIRNEGIDYCFENYSNWDEIKDEEFHRLRLILLHSMNEIKEYVEKKIESGETEIF